MNQHTTSRQYSRLERALRIILAHASIKNIIILITSIGLIGSGLIFLMLSQLTLPSIESFNERRVGQSTKIYDKTGTEILYDLNQNTRRTIVKSDEISQAIKDAIISIEDENFYTHGGISPISFVRATLVNIFTMNFSQGGSTITQQVVKNSLLSPEKTITRKVKEWYLAVNLERLLSKDEILNIYLNESPFGSNIYGVEEASRAFFGKPAKDVGINEAAHLAALLQAPTYYSPYGNHQKELEARKNLVLTKMRELGKISEEEFQKAKTEKVVFQPQAFVSIKAPHFVMYVKEYLEKTYGADALATRGLKITTTLDAELQKQAEETVKKYSLENQKKFNASNAALVAIDPKTGVILAMVGSRDYFEKEIDGNYNVATAERQPGSTFKPFVYAAAFNKGYDPESIVFDLPTEFSTNCNPDGTIKTPESNCYKPENYDNTYNGPITLRNALAQSKNVPAVKTLYLVGLRDAIKTARDLGLTTLKSNRDYGLTLVLGGGEVTLLDLTSAYGVFANEGVRNAPYSIVKIEEKDGTILEEHKPESRRVLDQNIALMVTDILSDNNARTPAFGANSALLIPGHSVAAKTGTTNDYRDVWIVGYTNDIVVGTWSGNNDNAPMEKKVAGMIVAPLWNDFMRTALKGKQNSPFKKPIPNNPEDLKPILRGDWSPQANNSPYVYDILHYVDRNNPRGPIPTDPNTDSQYQYWEYPVQVWASTNNYPSTIQQNATTSTSTLPIVLPFIPTN